MNADALKGASAKAEALQVGDFSNPAANQAFVRSLAEGSGILGVTYSLEVASYVRTHAVMYTQQSKGCESRRTDMQGHLPLQVMPQSTGGYSQGGNARIHVYVCRGHWAVLS